MSSGAGYGRAVHAPDRTDLQVDRTGAFADRDRVACGMQLCLQPSRLEQLLRRGSSRRVDGTCKSNTLFATSRSTAYELTPVFVRQNNNRHFFTSLNSGKPGRPSADMSLTRTSSCPGATSCQCDGGGSSPVDPRQVLHDQRESRAVHVTPSGGPSSVLPPSLTRRAWICLWMRERGARRLHAQRRLKVTLRFRRQV